VVAAAITCWPVVVALPALADDRNQSGDLAPTALAQRSVPSAYLNWYQQAARTCPGLSWTVLAGIGEIESGHGQSTAPGVHRASNYAGAQGPMQFEPATFAAYAVQADARHPLSVYNPQDAIFSAAKMLCENGAATGTQGGLRSALLSYNHADWYPSAVLAWAVRYGTAAPAPAPAAAAPPVPSPAAPAPAPTHVAPAMPAPTVVAPGHPAQVAAPKQPASAAGNQSASSGTRQLTAEQQQVAQHLDAQAHQLAAEAARLSALAAQLSAEAHQLVAKSTPPVSGSAQPGAARMVVMR